VPGILLLDVLPLSLGIEMSDSTMKIIISRNLTISSKRNVLMTIHTVDQTSVLIRIYEGERPETIYNNFLEEFQSAGIEPRLKGIHKLKLHLILMQMVF
jgi:L1 cell adhesion molecule like protein